jgi:hypothetical protein
MKQYLLTLLGLGAALGSCNIDHCEGAPDAHYMAVRFQLLPAGGPQSLFAGNGYFRDSVRVLTQSGQRVNMLGHPDPNARDVISFNVYESTSPPPLHTLITRQYIIYLKKTDQDTVRVEYQLFKNDCDNPDVDLLRVFYNDKKVLDRATTVLEDILIRKP